MNTSAVQLSNAFTPSSPAKASDVATVDAKIVKLGGCAPALAKHDVSRVRLGGCAPVLATHDSGRVRMGGCAPVLAA